MNSIKDNGRFRNATDDSAIDNSAYCTLYRTCTGTVYLYSYQYRTVSSEFWTSIGPFLPDSRLTDADRCGAGHIWPAFRREHKLFN
jgi:hypothetical protein